MRWLTIALLGLSTFLSTLVIAEDWYQAPFQVIDRLGAKTELSNDEHLQLALAFSQDLRVADAAEQFELTSQGLSPQLQMKKLLVDLVLANDLTDRQDYAILFDDGIRLASSLADYQSLAILLIDRAEKAIFQRDMDGALDYLEQALDVITAHELPLSAPLELAYARYYFESSNWPLVAEQIVSTSAALAEQANPAVEIEIRFLAFQYALEQLPIEDAEAELNALRLLPYNSQRLLAKIRRAEMLFVGAGEGNYIQAANALFDQIDQMQSASESLYAKHVIAHVMVANEDPQAVDAIADLSADLHRLPRNAFRDWIELDYWQLKYQYLRSQREFEPALFALEAYNTLNQNLWQNNSADRSERLQAYFSREAARYELALADKDEEISTLQDRFAAQELRQRWWSAFAIGLAMALILMAFVLVRRRKS